MLRAVSSIYIESQALELLSSTRRDVFKPFKLFRTSSLSTQAPATQTVLTSSGRGGESAAQSLPPQSAPPPPLPQSAPPPHSSHSAPPPGPRRGWHAAAAAAFAITASVGGFFYYRNLSDDNKVPNDAEPLPAAAAVARGGEEVPEPVPSSGAAFPEHVQFLLVGAGTAAFAAMRAIRSARPDAQVLMVGDERELPYMRPPLSKELWREPELAARAADPDALTFRQWNGRRRAVTYEPPAFYAPVERLRDAGGAAVARGWRVLSLDAAAHEAELAAPGRTPVATRHLS